MSTLTQRVVQVFLVLTGLVLVVLFRKTIKLFFTKLVKPSLTRVVTAFRTGL